MLRDFEPEWRWMLVGFAIGVAAILIASDAAAADRSPEPCMSPLRFERWAASRGFDVDQRGTSTRGTIAAYRSGEWHSYIATVRAGCVRTVREVDINATRKAWGERFKGGA